MTVALEFWIELLGEIGCVVGARGWSKDCRRRPEQHHVAQGSGKRDEFNRAVLCWAHHQGPAGLHGMGGKAFCRLYRPPGDHEFGLVTWTIEDAAKRLYERQKMKKDPHPAVRRRWGRECRALDVGGRVQRTAGGRES